MRFVIGFGDERGDVTVSCNREKWNNMPRFHSHQFYEMYYMVEGERYFFVGNKLYHVREGDALLISPETDHRSLDVNGEGYVGLVINLPRCHLPEDTRPKEELCMVRAKESIPEMTEWAELLVNAVGGRCDGMTAYLAVLRMAAALLAGKDAHPEAEIESPTLDRMAEILRYLEEHYTEGISLSSLSERFYISEFYLCRLFKEYTGRTLITYVTELRIRRAKTLLSTTDEPVSRIAREAGFGSVSAFGKAFRDSEKISPREYRARTRQIIK